MSMNPKLRDVPAITIRARYDNSNTVAILTPAEFRHRYAGRNQETVSAAILRETGATVVGVWHVYHGQDGHTHVSAPLNGDWLRLGGKQRDAHSYVVTYVITPRGRLNVVHGVGIG